MTKAYYVAPWCVMMCSYAVTVMWCTFWKRHVKLHFQLSVVIKAHAPQTFSSLVASFLGVGSMVISSSHHLYFLCKIVELACVPHFLVLHFRKIYLSDTISHIKSKSFKARKDMLILVVHVICCVMTYLTNTAHNTQYVADMLTKTEMTWQKWWLFDLANVTKKDMLIEIYNIY